MSLVFGDPLIKSAAILLGSLGLGLLVAVVVSRRGSGPAAGPSDFLRFVEAPDGSAGLETPVVRYRDRGGREVSLVSVVHVADAAYYDRLADVFDAHEVTLYEMVHDGELPEPGEASGGLIGAFQRALQGVLELEFQLDGIDYRREDFVHADLELAAFVELQRARNESILSVMLRAMLEQWKHQARRAEDGAVPLNGWTLLAALASPDRARSLKYLLAREFDSLEERLSGLGPDGEGTVLVEERNRAAIAELRRVLEQGRRRVAILYGAAHMPHLEERLRALGFAKEGERWLVAWDIPPPSSPAAGEGDDGA